MTEKKLVDNFPRKFVVFLIYLSHPTFIPVFSKVWMDWGDGVWMSLGFLWLEPLGPLGSLIEELGLIDLLLEVAACGITF